MSGTFSKVYNAWLKGLSDQPALAHEKAMRILGIGRATSYTYASGATIPTATKIQHFADCMRIPESKLTQILAKERGVRR